MQITKMYAARRNSDYFRYGKTEKSEINKIMYFFFTHRYTYIVGSDKDSEFINIILNAKKIHPRNIKDESFGSNKIESEREGDKERNNEGIGECGVRRWRH